MPIFEGGLAIATTPDIDDGGHDRSTTAPGDSEKGYWLEFPLAPGGMRREWHSESDLEPPHVEPVTHIKAKRPLVEYDYDSRCLVLNTARCQRSVPVKSLRTGNQIEQLWQECSEHTGREATKAEMSKLYHEFSDEFYEASWHHFGSDAPSLQEILQGLQPSGNPLDPLPQIDWPMGDEMELSTRTPSELLAMEFDGSDLILGDNLIALGQSCVIAGPPGTHKSGLALQLAVCCVMGQSFLGIETHNENLRWLFIQSENSNRRLKDDIAGLSRWVNDPAKWERVDKQIVFHTLEKGRDTLLSLDDPDSRAALERLIAKQQPDVIVFDPLRDFAIGDLNLDGDMRETVAALSQVCLKDNPKRAIIALHHALTGKTGAAKAIGYDRTSFARNSKVLLGWTRAQINVAPGDKEDTSEILITCGKNSNGAEFKPFGAKWEISTRACERTEDFDLEAWKAEVNDTGGKVGHQSNPLTLEALLAHVPPDGTIPRDLLESRFKESTGAGEKRVRCFIKEQLLSGHIHIHEVTRPRVRPEIHIGRTPQNLVQTESIQDAGAVGSSVSGTADNPAANPIPKR